jgi:hypothetical protein
MDLIRCNADEPTEGPDSLNVRHLSYFLSLKIIELAEKLDCFLTEKIKY